MEKLAGKSAIFAVGGLEIGKAVSLLYASEAQIADKTDPIPGEVSEMILPVYSLKHFVEKSILILVLVILSPFLLLISIFIAISSICSVLFKNAQNVAKGKSLNKTIPGNKFLRNNSTLHVEMNDDESELLHTFVMNPGGTYTWQIEPDNKGMRLNHRKEMKIQYIDNLSHKCDALLFLKTFQIVLTAKGS